MKLILASTSPRRAQILHDAGFSLTVVSSAVDEIPIPGESPHDLVQRLANAKAELVAARATGPAFVLAADTIVTLEGRIFGKPRSTDDARRMLEQLSGRTHAVQGRAGRYISRIEGDYFNVVGLPLARVTQALAELGWSED